MRENNFGKYLGFTCVKNTKEETIYEVVLNDNMLNPYMVVYYMPYVMKPVVMPVL